LRGDWVLVSPHRQVRPWQGQIEKMPSPVAVSFDPTCYLCPGNARAGGLKNPNYTSTFAFDNDFPALRPEGEGQMTDMVESMSGHASGRTDLLLTARSEGGICRVLCFSPRHDLTLGLMETDDIRTVVDAWIDEYERLAANRWVRYVQIFENRGEMMGASNPHPHCQIWATESLPDEPLREHQSFTEHRERTGKCLLCEYADLENAQNVRIVCDNASFLAMVPFWAVWPFETLIVSRRHLGEIRQLTAEERDALADILRRIAIRYDNLFEAPFPYSMGFHQAPVRDGSGEWHFHAHFYPPLLRSATIRKFMVGFELLGSPQRDLTAEAAAARLRTTSETHYLKGAVR